MIFGFSFFTTLVGLLILVLMIRTRAPHEGIRQWVNESRKTKLNWKERPFTGGQPGTLEEKDFTVGQDISLSALQDIENLHQAATQITTQLVEHHKNRPAKGKENLNTSLPPAIIPRPKGKKWKSVRVTNDSQKSEKLEVENPHK